MIEGGRTHITNSRNVLIFGADMSFSIHRTNRANHIYVVLSLHYNGDDSYLVVNGRQELKFK